MANKLSNFQHSRKMSLRLEYEISAKMINLKNEFLLVFAVVIFSWHMHLDSSMIHNEPWRLPFHYLSLAEFLPDPADRRVLNPRHQRGHRVQRRKSGQAHKGRWRPFFKPGGIYHDFEGPRPRWPFWPFRPLSKIWSVAKASQSLLRPWSHIYVVPRSKAADNSRAAEQRPL